MDNIKFTPEEEVEKGCATNCGFDYENKVTTLTTLTAALLYKKFDIKTNIVGYTPLDDICLEENVEETLEEDANENRKKVKYLIQIKHVNKPFELDNAYFRNDINCIDLKNANDTKLYIKTKKDKNSLITYSKKYVELINKSENENYTLIFIFYTNYNINAQTTKLFKIHNKNKNDLLEKLNISNENIFTLNKEYCKKLQLDEVFLNNTFFLSNQPHNNDIHKEIISVLNALLSKINRNNEQFGPLIIDNIIQYFSNIHKLSAKKPIITNELTLGILYYSCLNSRSIDLKELIEFADIENLGIYPPNLWAILKSQKNKIHKKYLKSIKEMIFSELDNTENDNVQSKILFNHSKSVYQKIINYYVKCSIGSMPFLIHAKYYDEIMVLLEKYSKLQVIFFDQGDKFKESKLDNIDLDISSNLCSEIYDLKIFPKDRKECKVENIIRRSETNDTLIHILKDVIISDLLYFFKEKPEESTNNEIEFPRYIYKYRVDNNLSNLDEDLVIILNWNKSKLELINDCKLNQISKNLILQYENNQPFNYDHGVKVIFTAEQTININHGSKNIHYLEYENEHFYWRGTNGNKRNLISLSINMNEDDDIDNENNNNVIKLERIPDYFINSKLIIFSGNPGIGKSISMRQLSRYIPSDIYVLLVNLTDKKELLLNLNIENNCLDILHLLYEEKNSFFSTICDSKYKSQQLCLIFDGYDEIAPRFVDKTDELIKMVLKENVKVIVTSRTILQDQIEKKFLTKSLILKPFNTKEQKEYLKTYLKKDNITDIAQDIINKIEDKIIGDKEFSSIPLHLKILCNILLKPADNKSFDLSMLKMSKLEIFEKFIEEKLKIFTDKSKNFNINIDNITEYHKNFALRKILPEVIDPTIEYSIEHFSNLLKKGSKNYGIVIANVEEIIFHRTIEEYFTALWLFDNRNVKTYSQKIRDMLKKIIHNKANYIVNEFFNALLYRKNKVYVKIKNNNFNKITFNEINETYEYGRNILHLLILSFDMNVKHKGIKSYLVQFLENAIQKQVEQDDFQLSPIYYAEEMIRETDLRIDINVIHNNKTMYFYFDREFNFLEFLICKKIYILNSELKFNRGIDILTFLFNCREAEKFNHDYLIIE